MKKLLIAALALGSLCTVHATWVADSVDVSLCGKSGSGTWAGDYTATGSHDFTYYCQTMSTAYDDVFFGTSGATKSSATVNLRIRFHLHWEGPSQPRSAVGSATIHESSLSKWVDDVNTFDTYAEWSVPDVGYASAHAQGLGLVTSTALNFTYMGNGVLNPPQSLSGTRTSVPIPIHIVGTNDYVGEFDAEVDTSAEASASRTFGPHSGAAGCITMWGSMGLDSVGLQPL